MVLGMRRAHGLQPFQRQVLCHKVPGQQLFPGDEPHIRCGIVQLFQPQQVGVEKGGDLQPGQGAAQLVKPAQQTQVFLIGLRQEHRVAALAPGQLFDLVPLDGQRSGNGDFVVLVRIGVEIEQGDAPLFPADVLGQRLSIRQFAGDQAYLRPQKQGEPQPQVPEEALKQQHHYGADGIDGAAHKDDDVLQLGVVVQPHLKAHDHGGLIDAESQRPRQLSRAQAGGVEQGKAEGKDKQKVIRHKDGTAQPLALAAQTAPEQNHARNVAE